MVRSFEEAEGFVGNFGHTLLDTYINNGQTQVVIEDSYGYKYDVKLSNLIRCEGRAKFVHPSNSFSIYNISIWLKINNKSFILCDNQVYTGKREKLIFYCYECNDEFKSSWNDIASNYGCGICHGLQVGKYNNLEYLYPELAKEWHPNNKLKSNQVTYGSGKKVWWICPECNHEWQTSPSIRIKNIGCPACSGNVASDKNRLSVLYPELALEWHSTKNGDLTPNDVSYASHKKLWWICANGHEYVSTIANRTNGKNCPKCKLYKGEIRISKFLDESNIKYITGYKFNDCRNIYPLPFDFYLPDYNLCIEYHGKQHYEINEFFGGVKVFNQQQKHDRIKEDYCRDNDIIFRAIPYWDFDNIEQILTETLL